MKPLRFLLLLLPSLLLFNETVSAQTYRLVTTTFLPFTDPDHEKGGFLVEVTRQALKMRGIEITVDYKPWARALSEAQEGRYDGLLSAFYNDERARHFYFSAPLNSTKMVLIGLKNKIAEHRYSTLSQLEPYTIAVGRKWAYSNAFETNTKLKKVIVSKEADGIRMLFNGRIDLFAVNIDQFNSTMARMPKYNINDTIILEPALSSNDRHIAVSKTKDNATKFLAEFNTGLAALKANGQYQQIRKDFFGF